MALSPRLELTVKARVLIRSTTMRVAVFLLLACAAQAQFRAQEIATSLVLSEHTIHRHVANVLGKLGVSSRAAAVAQAARHDLL